MNLLRSRRRVFGATSFLDQSGQSLIEFSLVLPVLLTLVFGVLELGHMMLAYGTIASAARIGMRYAVVHGDDRVAGGSAVDGPSNGSGYSQIQTVVENAANTAGVILSNPQVTVTYTDQTGASTTAAAVGNLVKLSVTYAYTPMISFLPLPATINMSSTTQGVICY